MYKKRRGGLLLYIIPLAAFLFGAAIGYISTIPRAPSISNDYELREAAGTADDIPKETPAPMEARITLPPSPSPSTTPQQIETSYLIKIYMGRIGVYAYDSLGQPELDHIIDMDVSFLRSEDQSRLEKGIEAKNRQEMNEVIEDFIE